RMRKKYRLTSLVELQSQLEIGAGAAAIIVQMAQHLGSAAQSGQPNPPGRTFPEIGIIGDLYSGFRQQFGRSGRLSKSEVVRQAMRAGLPDGIKECLTSLTELQRERPHRRSSRQPMGLTAARGGRQRRQRAALQRVLASRLLDGLNHSIAPGS